MTECCDKGLLRAYLDRALRTHERGQVAAHLASCGECRERLDELGAMSVQVAALIPVNRHMPDAVAALERLQREHPELKGQPSQQTKGGREVALTNQAENRRRIMQTISDYSARRRKMAFAGLAVTLVASMVAFPSVRAAADQFLQTFRAQSVVFVPVDASKISQLQALNFDPTELFVTEPTITGGVQSPRTVASFEEAATAVGFTPGRLSSFPGKYTGRQIEVVDTTNIQFQVNVAKLRQVLILLNVQGVNLPDAFGAAPIRAEIPPSVAVTYEGDGYNMVLLQGHTPTVTVPGGVDLSQLGKAALLAMGVPIDQADALSKQIDWATTLVVPFPKDLSNVHLVQIGNAQGMLVDAQAGELPGVAGRSLPGGYSALYWQLGDQFYVLEGRGTAAQQDKMIAAAVSVR